MIVHHGNRIEALVDVLAEVVGSPCGPSGDGPLTPETIAVQGPGMERWLSMELSQRLGVWANAWFPFPRRLLARAFDAVLGPADEGALLFEPESLVWAVAAVLPGLVEQSEFSGPRRFLRSDPDGARLLQLSRRIAETFDHYLVYRPEMVAGWETGRPGGDWQSTLWRELVARHGRHHFAARSSAFLRAIEAHPGPVEGLPDRVSVFGITTLPPLYVDVLSALARRVELHLFVLRCARTPALEGQGANPLWASLGAVGRHFAQVLDERAPDASFHALDPDPDPGRSGLLGRLQRAVFEGTTDAVDRVDGGESDGSIEVHSCHGPMREVEVLHDRLAALFEDDPSLEVRDVVVMTPDVERYAPYIQAVFDASPSRGGERPSIGYRLADRRVRATDEVVDALSVLLDALGGRLTTSAVVDLLMVESIRRRFEIEESDLDELIRWIRAAGIRWGADSSHRSEVGQPDLHQNTWRDGIDRLLLSMALPPDETALFAGHLPALGVDASRSELLGAFVEFAEALLEEREALSHPRSLGSWSEELGRLLDRLIEPGDDGAQQKARVRRALEKMAEEAAAAGFTETVSLASVRRELERRLERGTEPYGFLSGGVMFCELVPMRSIPFRVVALLGMGEEAFPRRHEPVGFDLAAASPRAGDRNVRDEDRHLFLEALVSAREHVIVTYPGRSLRDGSPCAPSVVVDELLEEIARMTGARLGAGEAGDGPSALVTSHPLHAFSPRYFDASDASLFSFSASDRMGAEALVAARARRQDGPSGKPWVEEALPQTPSEAPVLREVGVAELVRFFEHPVRAFMQRRLGLYLREDAPELEDREPLELDALGQWKLADLELRHRLGGVESERAGALLRASGSLPPGALGKLAEKAARDRAGALLARVEQARRGDLLEPVLVDRSLSGWQIRGEIGDLWSGGRVVHQLSKIPHRRELGFWIRHLVLNWLDAPGIPRESSLVAVEVQGRSRDPIVVHLAPHPDPEPVLRDLLALYELGLTVPLPLLGTVSRRHADRCANGGWHDAPLEAARREWENSFVGVSESDDAYLLQAFRDVDPFAAGLPGGETFESVTRRVYEPYLERRGSLDAGTSE